MVARAPVESAEEAAAVLVPEVAVPPSPVAAQAPRAPARMSQAVAQESPLVVQVSAVV